jgi:hypothetical protein
VVCRRTRRAVHTCVGGSSSPRAHAIAGELWATGGPRRGRPQVQSCGRASCPWRAREHSVVLVLYLAPLGRGAFFAFSF